VVQSNGKAGSIKLTATADGITTASVEITANK
jgi:hypothetical protein